MSRLQKAVFHTGVYGFGFVLDRGVAFLLVAVFTRLLSPAEFARWDLCAITILLGFKIFEFGIASALIRFYHEFEGKESRRRLFGHCVVFSVISAAALMGISLLFGDRLAQLLFGTDGSVYQIWLIAAGAAMTVLSQQPLALLRSQERSVAYLSLNLARAATGPIAIVLFMIRFDLGVSGALLGDLVGLTVMTIAGYSSCFKWLRLSLDWRLFKPVLLYALPLVPVGVSGVILTVSDRYFLQRWVGLGDDMAVFGLASRISLAMLVLTRAFQMAWPPSAFQIAKEADAPATFEKVSRWLLLCFLTPALGIVAFAPEWIRFFASKDIYSGAYKLIPWICLSYALSGFTHFVSVGITIQKKTLFSSIVSVTSAAFKILLNVLLIPAFGIMGAAVSTLFAFVLQAVLMYAVAQKLYPIPYQLGKIFITLFLAATTAIAIVWVTPLGGALGPSLRFLLLLAFVTSTAFLLITAEEKRQAFGLLQKGVRAIRH